jgi:hypothetical protein
MFFRLESLIGSTEVAHIRVQVYHSDVFFLRLMFVARNETFQFKKLDFWLPTFSENRSTCYFLRTKKVWTYEGRNPPGDAVSTDLSR